MRLFFTFLLVTTGISVSAQNIVYAEYFFNTDPGYGNGISIPILPGGVVEVDDTLDLSGLSCGSHTLFVRAQDDSGAWSLTFAKPFLKANSQASPKPNIVRGEYFFDTDPGFGNGTPISIISGKVVDIADTLDLAGLPGGSHTLHIRAQDETGAWSVTQVKTILKSNSQAFAKSAITAIEYFFGNDPGYGNGFQLPVPFDSILDTAFIASSAGLDTGWHLLFIRAKDQAGNWSLTHHDSIRICEHHLDFLVTDAGCFDENNGSVDLSVSGNSTPFDYNWSSGENTEDLTGVPPGVYTVSVANHTGCTLVDSVIVLVNDTVPPFFTNCPSDTIFTCSPITGLLPTADDACSFALVSGGLSGGQLSAMGLDSVIFVATDSSGNSATCTRYVFRYGLPEVNAGADTNVNVGDTVSLGGSPTAVGNGPFNYIWTPGFGLTSTTVANPTAFPTTTKTYTVFAIDSNGCAGTDKVNVTVNGTPSTCERPANSFVDSLSASSAELHWSLVPNAIGYHIQYQRIASGTSSVCHRYFYGR